MDYDTIAEAELLDGTMRLIELGGQPVLLARVDGVCHAVEGHCPHAGAPLDQGVLDGGVVICPWHKAAFRVATGRLVDPPALDDLRQYPVRNVDGRLVVTVLDGASPGRPIAARAHPCMVIIGAGAAGTLAAQTLREDGFGGRVVLVSPEDRLPYDRTVLSKYTLSGTEGGEKDPLHEAEFYERQGIERRLGTVTAIDPADRSIAFADGTTIRYDAALLATGGTARPLDMPGAQLPGVFLLRSAADAERIVQVAPETGRVVVAGGGFIALESAASLRERGLDVTVVAPQSEPFEKQLGPEVGAAIRRLHQKQGVSFRLSSTVAAIEGAGHVEAVRLDDGTRLAADMVVAGMGIRPNTEMLRGIERRRDLGVDVDASLRVADGLFAAGDVAGFPLYGAEPRVRVEHWRVAQQQGRVAARAMLGSAACYDAVPYFWTTHFMQRLDYVGHAEAWDELVVDGDLDVPEFVAFYLQSGRVAAVAGWGRDRVMARVLALFGKRHDWDLPGLREAMRQ